MSGHKQTRGAWFGGACCGPPVEKLNVAQKYNDGGWVSLKVVEGNRVIESRGNICVWGACWLRSLAVLGQPSDPEFRADVQ